MSLGVVEVGWHSDNCIFNLLAEIGFGDFLHFDQNHCRDFFRGKHFSSNSLNIINLNEGLSLFVDDVEGKIFFVVLHIFICIFPSDESLHVVKGSGWVVGGVVFG